MSCRKNQATLTLTERQRYATAVLALKSRPSLLSPPSASRYDDYVQVHMDSMAGSRFWAHRRPAFLAWHREFLRRFERDLQVIDPTVTLPYWDWTVNQNPAVAGTPFTDDFMGGNGDPADQNRVKSGPFRQGQWTLNLLDGPGDSALQRQFGSNAAPTLPSSGNVADTLTVTPLDAANWNPTAQPSFRNRLEGWYGPGSVHNRVHLWVGGSMLPGSSPNDPIFFLHHANIDRLWAEWQRLHPGEPYVPAAGTSNPPGISLDGHRLTDPMQPWGGGTTVASTLNHHAMGYWYDTDPPEINLLTPSLNFLNVPEGLGGTGVTTYRAVHFDVLACEGVTLQIVSGPTAPFSAPLGMSTTVSPPIPAQDAPTPGRVWIAYTSTTAGASVTGSVTVHAPATGQTWTVTLSANTVARPKAAVALVLDRSGSMSEDAGDGQPKVQKLKEAVSVFVNAMLPGDGLSVVSFDDTASLLLGVTDVGPVTPVAPGSGREQASLVLSGTGLDPRGNTSIGAGLQTGRQALDAAPATTPPYSVRSMLVLTDGNENTPPSIATASAALSATTYAIGFGTAANVSAAKLNEITQNHGGYLMVTGAITPGESFRLSKYFLQVLAGVNNASIVLDPQGDLVYGAEHRLPFFLNEADYGADVFLLSPVPRLIDFQLETPDGTRIRPVGASSAVSFVSGPRAQFYRFSLPALPSAPTGSHAGRWHAVLTLGRSDLFVRSAAQWPGRSLPYSLLVHAYSNLTMQARAVQSSYEPGAVVKLSAQLSEYDTPVEGRARVHAELRAPNGTLSTVPLPEVSPGHFEGVFQTAAPGVYSVRVMARGQTYSGRPFTREQTVTAVAIAGGDRPVPDPAPQGGDLDRWCDLLRCLTGKDVLGERLQRSLADLGVNLDALHTCLDRLCRSEHPSVMETVRETREVRDLGLNADLLARLLMMTDQTWDLDPGPGIATLTPPEPWTPEPTRRPVHDHGEPMFDLSPEDKAAGGHDQQPDVAPLPEQPGGHHHDPGTPPDHGFRLSAEDLDAGGHDQQSVEPDPDRKKNRRNKKG